MYEMAKKSREAMKAKARRLASETVGKVDSSTWSPAPLLRADIKTGARPIMKPSKKGIGESNQAADTKAAIGNPTRGAFKDGGGVKDKKALGAIDPSPKRGAAQHYKKGGRIKRKDGGADPSYVGASSVTKDDKPVTRPKDIKDTRQREPDASDLYTPDQAKRVEQGYKKGGKAKKIAKKKGGGVGLTVVIADKGGRGMPQQSMAAPIAPRAVPMPPPQAAPPMPPAPMPAAPPPAQMMPPPMGRKAGGRITKVASSYKDMEAGAATGEGRLQKTDIAEKHKGAPTRKTGGRISKIASSYKDMTAGAGDGEGRLQKTDIAKKRKFASLSHG